MNTELSPALTLNQHELSDIESKIFHISENQKKCWIKIAQYLWLVEKFDLFKQDEKYNAKNIAERHRDHALFIAYAPADNPQIAIAVIVENGGHGGSGAGPIARQLMDYYLLGKLPPGAIKKKALPKGTEEITLGGPLHD